MRLGYLRHENGRGRLFGESEADSDSYVDTESELHDRCRVFRAEVIASTVRGMAIVSTSRIENCEVGDRAKLLSGKIENSTFFDDATVCGGTGDMVSVNESSLHGSASVFGRARVEYADIRDAYVYGSAELIGRPDDRIVIDGHCRIGSGRWSRAPRFKRFHDLGVSISESDDGHIYIGCLRRPSKYWLERGPRIGERFGWTREQVHAVDTFIRSII